MVACANEGTEATARPGAECFDRPLRDGCLFLHFFPVLRTGLREAPAGLIFANLRPCDPDRDLLSLTTPAAAPFPRPSSPY
jgi:hypothetical protein